MPGGVKPSKLSLPVCTGTTIVLITDSSGWRTP
jgi:hypothetical protein